MRRRWTSVLVWGLAATLTACASSGGETSNSVPGGRDGRSVVPLAVDESATGRIALGNAHSCAIRADDVIVCWGDNQNKQFPRPSGAPYFSAVPVQVTPLGGGRTPARLAAGSMHTCALATDGSVWCWGANGSGQLGINSWSDTATPTEVTLPTTAATVAAGGRTTCALLTDGSVWCWGENDENQLGIGSDTTSKSTPVKADFPAGTPVTSLAVGPSHACAGASTGALWCWGAFGDGRLGVPAISNLKGPTATQSFSPAPSMVTTGGSHTCVVTGSAAKCFGNNAQGQLGVSLGGASTSTPTPQQTVTSGVVAVAAGEAHTCFGLTGSVRCAGQGFTGLQTVAGISGSVTDVAAGASHSCAVMSSGEVRCWGNNSRGQLGTGDTTDSWTAAAVGSLNVIPTTTTSSTTSTTAAAPITSTTATGTAAANTPTTSIAPTSTTAPAGSTTSTSLTVRKGRALRAVTVVKAVKMTVPTKGQGTMRLSIVAGTKYCAFKGSSIKGVRKGRCTIRVMLIPKTGRIVSKKIVIRVV